MSQPQLFITSRENRMTSHCRFKSIGLLGETKERDRLQNRLDRGSVGKSDPCNRLKKMVGASGFETPASRTRSRISRISYRFADPQNPATLMHFRNANHPIR